MAAVAVDPAHVHAFADAGAFHDWLARHHDRETEVWIRIYKVRSGAPSITPEGRRAFAAYLDAIGALIGGKD